MPDAPIKTFIVDDQEDIRILLRTFLEAANGELVVVGEASDAFDALDRVDELDPNVIILDYMMPGMSGLDLARAIRVRRPDQRMVLCTAFLDDQVRQQAAAAGIAGCLPKMQLDRVATLVREVATGSSFCPERR